MPLVQYDSDFLSSWRLQYLYTKHIQCTQYINIPISSNIFWTGQHMTYVKVLRLCKWGTDEEGILAFTHINCFPIANKINFTSDGSIFFPMFSRFHSHFKKKMFDGSSGASKRWWSGDVWRLNLKDFSFPEITWDLRWILVMPCHVLAQYICIVCSWFSEKSMDSMILFKPQFPVNQEFSPWLLVIYSSCIYH